MRSVAVLFCTLAILVCSTIHAQNKIDLAKPPAPPPPTSVNVLNFPDVQAVAGTVSVDNLPAVQTVGGTVNVGNLSLDTDGALRVTSAPARQVAMFELLDSPSEHVQDYTLPLTVDTTGYSAFGLAVTTGPASIDDVVYHVYWSLGESDPYVQVNDYRHTIAGGCSSGHLFSSNVKIVCPTIGGRVQVAVSASPGVLFTSVRLYLIP